MEFNCCKTICSLLLITLAFGLLVNGFEFDEGDFTPCSEGILGRLIALRTNSCDSFPQPCTLYTGNIYNFEMEFETGSASTDISYVTGIIGIELPWPDGPQGPSCHLISDGSCPYGQGQRLIFRAYIFVNPLYPQVPVIGRWRLRDHLDQNHICLNIPLQIRNGGSGPSPWPSSTAGPSTTAGISTTRPTSHRPESTTNGATNIFSISILTTLLSLLPLFHC